MPIWKEYLLAHSLSEALQILASSNHPTRLLAGGTDLLIDLQQGRCTPVHTLVDIHAIDELCALELRGSEFFIGAAVPMVKIVASPLVKKHAWALGQACDLVGGPQVRNMATLGGNVAHALPAADGTIALLSLDAQAEVADLQGRRRLPLRDLFIAPGQTILTDKPGILVGFYIQQAGSGETSVFKRVMRPQGVALPIINMAIWLRRKLDYIDDIRIALGPAGIIPFRAVIVEQILRGCEYSKDIQLIALDSLEKSVQFRSSPDRASAAYRRHLAENLFAELLDQAWFQAASSLSVVGDKNHDNQPDC